MHSCMDVEGACWALQECSDVCWEWMQWCSGKESPRILWGENSCSSHVVVRTQNHETWAPVAGNCDSADHASWARTFHKRTIHCLPCKPWTQLNTPNSVSRRAWTDPLEFLSKIVPFTLQTDTESHFLPIVWDTRKMTPNQELQCKTNVQSNRELMQLSENKTKQIEKPHM